MTPPNDDPPLALAYGFQPPVGPNVIVSTDPVYPMRNTLSFNIRNPSGQPVLNFENPDQLTPQSDLPPITARDWPKPLDRLYLRFPWCDGEPPECSGYLTTRALMGGIDCSPAPGFTDRWYTRPMSDPTFGLYWVLFPKDKTVHIGPNENIQLVISGILTYIGSGTMTSCYIKPMVKGYAQTDSAVANVFLIDPPPRIELKASADNILAGTEVKLTWQTVNAKSCLLSPVDGGPAPVPTDEVNGYAVRPLTTTSYTLQAFSPSGKTNYATIVVHVKPVAIRSFRAEPAEGVRLGDPVALRWATESAARCEITPAVGPVCQNATGCDAGSQVVTPGQFTTYTLTAYGQDGPRTAHTYVLPLPIGWTKLTSYAPFRTGGRSPLLVHQPPNAPTPQLWLLNMADDAFDKTSWVFYSNDGASWSAKTNNAAWSPRGGAAGAAFNGKMWLMGGVDRSGAALNDVWSSDDGAAWSKVTGSAGWSARSGLGCIVFGGRLWVMGGADGNDNALNDVWSTSDGAQWKQETGSADWSPRSAFSLTTFGGKLWLVAGRLNNGSGTSDVWTSADGVNWQSGPTGSWQSRYNPNVQVIDDTLYLIGGTSFSGEGIADFNKYTTDGGWTGGPGPGWGKTQQTGSVLYQKAIWLAGGNQSGAVNKVVWLYAPFLPPG